MANRRKSSFIFFMLPFFPFFPLSIQLSTATDTISRGKSLSGDQTIVSKGGNFELGFFTPGKSRNYYISIWHTNVPNQNVVWVANRNKPVSNATSSELAISEDGNLVIHAQSKVQIWSSKTTLTHSNSTIAVLLDNGNLVLKHLSSDQVLWQSFDHPTNTWLPGAKLGYNKITGENQFLTSWRNPDDPSPGLFSLEIDPDGIIQFYILRCRTQRYWASGVWKGKTFGSAPDCGKNFNFKFFQTANVNVNFFSYIIPDPSVIASVVLDYTGQMKQQQWDNDTQQWVLYSSYPVDPCDVPDFCGSFGTCNSYSVPSCQCLQGFQPMLQKEWERGVPSGGCVRKTPLHCGDGGGYVGGEKDKFWEISNIQLPISSNHVMVDSQEECASACLLDCSCTAYSYNNGCLMWNGELLNLKQSSDAPYDGGETRILYLRLAAPEFGTSRDKIVRNWMTILMVVVAVAGFSVIVVIISVFIWRSRTRKRVGTSEAVEDFLLPYPYQVLKRATNDFSNKLGSGSFGSVFKGTLPNSTLIAVKKLEGVRQGEKQFRMEVSTIGMIHHVNLVRLLGFCSESARRLLVYDYAPNGSLDSHLFQQNTWNILDWSQRYQIALGIARGLEYLHDKCRECIIHCDIKPENILLDELMRPKLTDFGMAKLIGREYSRVLTTMRGTLGYLAPEWISGAAITPKVDVYSFGMMLLEIISGRRNSEILEGEALSYFPILVATRLHEGDVLSSLDHRLGGMAKMEELNRACRVACWCIQDQESCRPQMRQVVQILEGALDVSTPPIPKLLWNLTFLDGLATIEAEYI